MSKDLFSSRTPFEKCYLVENVKHLSFIPGNRTLRTAHVNRIFKAFLDGYRLSMFLQTVKFSMVRIVSQHFVC